MKIWAITKNILIYLCFLGVFIYTVVIFALPWFLNKHDYSVYLTDLIAEKTGLVLIVDKYKLTVSPNLDIAFNAKSVELFYPDKKQIIDAKNVYVGLSPFALFKKELKLNKFFASELQFSTKLLKSGKTTFSSYLEKHVKLSDAKLTFSKTVPKVKIDKYVFKVKDEESNKLFKLTGDGFDISQGIDYKFFNLKTKGVFYCDNKRYLTYNSKFFVPKELLKDFHSKVFDVNLGHLVQHNFSAVLNSDLKIHVQDNKVSYVSGYANIDNFVLNLNGYKLPPSYFHFIADKGYANLVSQLFLNKTDVAEINAKIRISKPWGVELVCKCPNANLDSLQKIILPVLDILKIDNQLKLFKINGSVSADFKLITDFKAIKSNGKFEIKNASMKHNTLPLLISNANANIDFANNLIEIKESNLLVNNQPVSITGIVKQDSTCDIIAKAHSLDLKNLVKAFPFVSEKLFTNFRVDSGQLDFVATFKGKLLEVVPVIKLNVYNLALYDKDSKFRLLSNNLNADITTNSSKYRGKLNLKKVSIIPNSTVKQISKLNSDNIDLILDNTNIHLPKAKFYSSNSYFTVTGDINNYSKVAELNFISSGTIDSSFLASFLPCDMAFQSKGSLPFKFYFKGKAPSYSGSIQILANSNNFISPFYIKDLENKSSLTNIQFNLAKNSLLINDLSLFNAGTLNSLKNEISFSKMDKLFIAKGKINNIDSATPSFDNLKLQTKSLLGLTFNNAYPFSALLSVDIILNGLIQNPAISGFVNITNFSLPAYHIKVNSLLANLSKNKINLKIDKITNKNMVLSANLVLPTDFYRTNIINNISINADYLDLDQLLYLSTLLPQSRFAPGVEFPYTITSGNISIKSFKSGDMNAQNIVADLLAKNNVLNLNNLAGNAYEGNIVGQINYNFPYSSINAKIQGRGLNAASMALDLMPKEHHISGDLNFDADVKMFGNTPEAQIESMRGKADVVIKNGHLGQLGRFEHFLYAQNLLSQRFIYASLNSAKQAISPKNTGNISYLKGVINFRNGYAYFSPVLTSGPNMSMYITGNMGLKNNIADLVILGKISSEVSSSLGLLGNMTIKGLVDEHTKYGQTLGKLFNFFNSELPEVDISKIPPLSPDLKYATKDFRVIISGNTSNVSSVKSFTWVNPIGTHSKILSNDMVNSSVKSNNIAEFPVVIENPKQIDSQSSYSKPITTDNPIYNNQNNGNTPDFLDNIPDTFN